MRYVLQYRVRIPGLRNESQWKDAQTFDLLDEANKVCADAIKYEMKGTKDWRVRAAVATSPFPSKN